MRNVVLHIDTSDSAKVQIGLSIDGKVHQKVEKIASKSAQIVLPMIEQLLSEYKITFHELTAIDVTTGPGSYTGLRIGVAIANTLGVVLQIPINGKAIGEIVEPVYET